MKSSKLKKKRTKVLTQEVSDIELIVDNTNPDKPMIDRKATQAKLDIEKKVRYFRSLNRDDQQIASLLGIDYHTIKAIK